VRLGKVQGLRRGASSIQITQRKIIGKTQRDIKNQGKVFKNMKITICGSIKFAKEIIDVYDKVKSLGHEPVVHEQMKGLAEGTASQLVDKANGMESSEIKKKYNYIKWWYGAIVNSDAVLICNFDKNGIKNYVGGNSLMEIGFAHVNNKKIFLLNPVPDEVPYVDEIKAMVDVVLDGDLTKIK